nr:toll/interleukin-1 receptor domain-containing protein [Streptomyces sp. NBC_00886]
MHTRLWYQRQDERAAFALADALGRAGADVVLDVSPPGPDGAAEDGVVVLLWSAAWSRTPMDPGQPSPLVPVRLDDTPLPAALEGLRHVRLTRSSGGVSDEGAAMIVHLGFSTTAPAPAVRGEGAENALTISDFGPLGLFATCPGCDVSSDRLRPYVTVDHHYDRALRLVICGACEWQDYCDL